ncbi:hypothetical protein BGZ58_011320 [Dissophora ornata]|nr:hypothetical protein BGZ58_011320 [Dissophora ornata]
MQRAASTTAALLYTQSRTRTTTTTTLALFRQAPSSSSPPPLRAGQYFRHNQYSSLRRRVPAAGNSQGSRGGRLATRSTGPSRVNAATSHNLAAESSSSSQAAPLAGAASALNHGSANVNTTAIPQEQVESNVVEGIDIAATPAVVPKDPFGVLQPYDTAAKLLTQPALIMTRQVEMMNLLVGFEQANKYAIVDPSGTPIGYIAEEDTTMVKAMSRQLLRTHRPFKASVLDLEGNEVLKIHRPFAFINSRIMISTPDDRLIGEVQQEWHLIRRRYNLFTIEQPDPSTMQSDSDTTSISTERNLDGKGLDRVQFAHIDGGFLALDFDMHDEQGQKMASVNRNFVGFARELFTDSGQYALRFDAAVIQDLQQEQGLGATTTTTSAQSATSAQELEQAKEIQANKDEKALAQLESRGGLTLDQRAIIGILPIPMMMGGGGHAPVASSSEDNPMGTVMGAGAGAGAGHVLGGAAAGDIAGGAVAGGMPVPPSPMPSAPPAAGGGAWGDDLPAGTPTNEWGEDVWAEDNTASEDSGDSWFGGGKSGGGGGDGEGGGGFDWGDLL